ncbi:Surfactin synthase subunit [Lentibacillus sp. JNUCC-1]|uniref:class I adenylate-forming enzyme family protein n=1 Tax=Lentibacillus sp. JNUCC-1 TaxID=2654513 RepID=UPI0012E839AF|nr:long-chain fatty acid--CoA ligase [Lentibacillus sp. JNUCC-1]MUV37698.1 Surfactin synthase subunit [Lentibacillus sp. JNUCC-1]
MQANINWFESRVALTPNDTAVIDSQTKEEWTYTDLNARAEKLSAHLTNKGVQKGDRVALLAPNHISYFDFALAAMKLGCIFVPVNNRLAKDELLYILNDCDPKVIAVETTLEHMVQLDTLKTRLMILDGNGYVDHVSDSDILSPVTITEEDPLAMIYTGGTTGRPKGVVLSHRSILWNALNTIITWDLSRNDTTLTTLPMFHTGGLNVFSLPLLLIGGKVVIAPDFHPEKAVRDLIAYQCTTALFVPTMYHMMVQTDMFQQAEFPDLKVLVSGGAPCPQKIYDAFREKGIAFKEGYGLTEAGPNNFYIDPRDTDAKPGSVGKPMLFNDIRIVTETGYEAQPEEIGELLIRGHHSFEYYWNNPEETDATLVDGWVHTGDLARQDADGYVYIVGRKKDMIITGGENVYPLEIEHWLEAHDAVDEAAVVGVPDEKWGEKVVGFVVLKAALETDELAAYCKAKLTSYKVPKDFCLLDTLPKTHVGKIDKKALRNGYQGRMTSLKQ